MLTNRFTYYLQWLGKQENFLDDPNLYQGLIFFAALHWQSGDLSLNFTIVVDGTSPTLMVFQPGLTQVLRVQDH